MLSAGVQTRSSRGSLPDGGSLNSGSVKSAILSMSSADVQSSAGSLLGGESLNSGSVKSVRTASLDAAACTCLLSLQGHHRLQSFHGVLLASMPLTLQLLSRDMVVDPSMAAQSSLMPPDARVL
eukprot:CAMPEP_0118939626 /NCGR_PEP_ID=MMETSP1169-20130426/29366_1 /TAXON_ID=36882 /ORGANISM="Pyramimonas obovata, Strain CCMP722" /LENGTH=123 /DNA_ID=CAMNT_0006883933 /DNA_START=1900 /DNA_END=2272 /DNA_ORIENTATION=-